MSMFKADSVEADPNKLYSDVDNLNFRSYQKIHVDEVVDNYGTFPVLGYNSQIDEIVFKSGADTFFHFPLSGEHADSVEWTQLKVEDSSLIYDGAIQGVVPWQADRIYKKNASYAMESVWGESLPKWKDTGVWLCTWLSGDPTDYETVPVWVDRWYNPSGVPEQEAYLKKHSEFIYDQKSTLTFDPGVYYIYHHFGNENVDEIVKDIDTSGNLFYHFDDWEEVKERPYVVGFNMSNENYASPGVNPDFKTKDKSVSFNGEKQAIGISIPRDNIITDGEFTIAAWIKNQSWENGASCGIIDQGFRGGYKIAVNNRPNTKLSIYFDSEDENKSQNGNMVILNEYGNLICKYVLGNEYRIIDATYDQDLFVWVYAKKNDAYYLIQLDYNGNKMDTVQLDFNVNASEGIVTEPTRVTISPDGNQVMLYGDTRTEEHNKDNIYICYFVNPFSHEITHGRTKFSTGNNVQYYVYESVDDTGETVTNQVPYILDDKRFWVTDDDEIGDYDIDVATPNEIEESPKQIVASMSGKIWVLYAHRVVCFEKTDAWRPMININLSSMEPTAIDLMTTIKIGQLVEEIYVTDRKNAVVKIYDASTGKLRKDVNLGKYATFPTNRSMSSYDWWRRFGLIGVLYARVCFSDNPYNSINAKQTRYTLSFPLSKLASRAWHHVAISRETGENKDNLILYVDCMPVDSVALSANDRYVTYPYMSQMCLGGDCGRTRPLGEENNFETCYGVFGIDDLRFYRKHLNSNKLFYIYMSKFKYEDMVWSLQANNKYYLEEIEKFFRFKMPGSKSAHYKIHICGFGVPDEVKRKIEEAITETLPKLAPVYTKNTEIIWD